MTMTVKLDPSLEQRVRERSAAAGISASEAIRQALQAWLGEAAESERSAHELGEGLFGRHRGPANLAETRKRAAADVWGDKHARRG